MGRPNVLSSVHAKAVAAVEIKADGERLHSAEQKLADLYTARAGHALRIAFLMTGDASAAEDIVQEAFVKTFARLKDRRSPDRLDAYLRRTVINLSHDRHRKLRSARQFLARASRVSEPHSDMDSSLAFSDLLHQLPHRQRAALVLRYYEDLSEQDAADILNCSVAALKQLVQRALKNLRSDYQGDDHA